MVQKNRHMSKKIDITSLYLSDYNLYFSGREIGRLVKINHQTAMNLLKQLVKEKVLTIVKKGRSNLYYLNLDSFECTYYLQIAEIVKARNALSNVELKLVIEKIVSLCETVIVFGSFSSGKQKNSSDIDLVVVSPRSKVKIQDEIKIFPREINIEYPFLGYRKNKFSSEINHYVSKKRKFVLLFICLLLLPSLLSIKTQYFWRSHYIPPVDELHNYFNDKQGVLLTTYPTPVAYSNIKVIPFRSLFQCFPMDFLKY